MNTDMATTRDWISTRELAHRLGVHMQTVRRMALAGIIPAIRIGLCARDWRFSVKAVEAALDRRRAQLEAR